jgi:hypothetical protein
MMKFDHYVCTFEQKWPPRKQQWKRWLHKKNLKTTEKKWKNVGQALENTE